MIFKVLVLASPFAQSLGSVNSFLVTDQPDNYAQIAPWPAAAEFKVSTRHDQELQKRRAEEYCEYLNKHITVAPPIGQ